MKVLVIDGPARGQIYDARSHRFLAVDSSFDNLGDIKEVVYHVHKFIIVGRMIRLASTSAMSDEISDENVFELIMSDKAKEVAI